MTSTEQSIGNCRLLCGDSWELLLSFPPASIDCCCTDPPYHLTTAKRGGSGLASLNLDSPAGRARIGTGFMGQAWDGGNIAHDPTFWAEVLRVLKPGGHLVAFGGSRTHHRLMCAIEDAGFEIRDTISYLYDSAIPEAQFFQSLAPEQQQAYLELHHAGQGRLWVYGSGFPKSTSVGKGIDQKAGMEREVIGKNPNHRSISGIQYSGVYAGGNTGAAMLTAPATDAAKQWDGWGTALKPAMELIVVARKPLSESTVAANVLKWGTGALNIDGCRILLSASESTRRKATEYQDIAPVVGMNKSRLRGSVTDDWEKGRWPANLCHDGSEQVLAGFPDADSSRAHGNPNNPVHQIVPGQLMSWGGIRETHDFRDTGSAVRFFYTAKVAPSERDGSTHPTMKPVSLMRWLVRLVTPPGGLVCDPFLGSGTTALACLAEGMRCLGIEREAEYIAIARKRLLEATRQGDLFSREKATKSTTTISGEPQCTLFPPLSE